jgi:hypothetical protein
MAMSDEKGFALNLANGFAQKGARGVWARFSRPSEKRSLICVV